MHTSAFLTKVRQHLAVGASLIALSANLATPLPAEAKTPAKNIPTTTPIKHVIVIIGENRTFDHVFATYQPVKGQTIKNLLSEGIVNADGTPRRHRHPHCQRRESSLRALPDHVGHASL
jgi:phospholipase C